MVSLLLAAALLAAAFVGFNIGGSSTGVAWGPSVGANLINKTVAGGLMTAFVLLGGWTVGRKVIETLGSGLVPADAFSLSASLAILVFVGLGMLAANVYGVPVSTSMTAVGAVAGFGYAEGVLRADVLAGIVVWWIVAPIVGFWCGGVVGRYFYPSLDRRFDVQQSEGPLVVYDWRGPIPVPRLGPGTTPREFASAMLLLAIACYMSFSAGASNVANAVAPLVGTGAVDLDLAILLGAGAIGLGAFTIARRTMEAVGNDLTALPLLAATIVMVVGASITTVLSWAGIPISLALSTVMCIVGLGWGRATRSATARELLDPTERTDVTVSVDAITTETPAEPQAIGEESREDLRDVDELFDPSAVVRFVTFWIVGPTLSTGLTYAFFAYVPLVH